MMSVYRTPPNCMFCGESIQGLYDIETEMIGDNFLGWDYEGHECDKNNIIDFEELKTKFLK